MVLVMIEYAYWALINFFAAVNPPPPLAHTMRANVLPVGCIGQGLCSAVGAPGYNQQFARERLRKESGKIIVQQNYKIVDIWITLDKGRLEI